MAKLVTHKDIHQYMVSLGRDISLERVIVMGAKGVFGDPVIAFPKHYKEGPAFKGAREWRDQRFKITDAGVKDILRRVKKGERQSVLAEKYGVHESAISLIVRNKRRKKAS